MQTDNLFSITSKTNNTFYSPKQTIDFRWFVLFCVTITDKLQIKYRVSTDEFVIVYLTLEGGVFGDFITAQRKVTIMKRFLSVLLSLVMTVTMFTVGTASVSAVDVQGNAESMAESSENEASYHRGTIDSLQVTNLPAIEYYYSGDEGVFNFDGIELTATYDDGTTDVFTGKGEYFKNKKSENIEYDYWVDYDLKEIYFEIESDTYKLLQFTATYTEVQVTSIELTYVPDDLSYFVDGTSQYMYFKEILEFDLVLADGRKFSSVDFVWFNTYFSGRGVTGTIYDEYFLKVREGENEITLNWGKCKDTFIVYGKTVASVEITKNPEKFQYIAGEESFLNGNGVEIVVKYNDGSTETFDYLDGSFLFSGANIRHDRDDGCYYITPAEGENTITISYGGKSDTFTITGITVTDFEILTPPTETKFVAGCDYEYRLYLDGLSVKVTYGDGTTKISEYSFESDYIEEPFAEISYQGDAIYNYFNLDAGNNEIVLTYGGKSDSFAFTGCEVSDIKLLKAPTTTYLAGVTTYFDYTGMELEITYTDGSTVVYDDTFFIRSSISLFGEGVEDYYGIIYRITPKLGDNLITVECGGCTDTFIANGKEVSGIEILKLPEITEYKVGERYYYDDYFGGLEFKVTYTDDTNEVLEYVPYTSMSNYVEFSGDDFGDYYSSFVPIFCENEITMTYGGKSDTFIIYGVDDTAVLGDANGDGEINILDATLVQSIVARYETEDVNLKNADVDGNGEITIQDATFIQMYVGKMITDFTTP